MLLALDVHAGPQRGEASFVIARKGPNGPIARRLVLKGTLTHSAAKKAKALAFLHAQRLFFKNDPSKG